MDNIWAYREIYDKARKIKETQDSFCQKVSINEWDGLDAFPDDLQYEALVDVLRGRVKVQVHCYEAVDLDDIVRVSLTIDIVLSLFPIRCWNSCRMSSVSRSQHFIMHTKPTLFQIY